MSLWKQSVNTPERVISYDTWGGVMRNDVNACACQQGGGGHTVSFFCQYWIFRTGGLMGLRREGAPRNGPLHDPIACSAPSVAALYL